MLKGHRARKDLSVEVGGGTGRDMNFPLSLTLVIFSYSIFFSCLFNLRWSTFHRY